MPERLTLSNTSPLLNCQEEPYAHHHFAYR